MRADGHQPVELVLRGKGPERIEIALDAFNQRAVSAHAMIRLAADSAVLASRGLQSRSRAGSTVDAGYRLACRGAATEHVPPDARTQGVSVSARRPSRAAPDGVSEGAAVLDVAARVSTPEPPTRRRVVA